MTVMGHTTRIYLLSLFFIVGQTKNDYCMGYSSCGYTIPVGDITVEYGNPLNITCNLYPTSQEYLKHGNSILYFKSHTGPNLYINKTFDILNEEDERVEVVNSTSIRLYVRKPQKMNRTYYCMCGSKTACTNTVFVGIPPQDITDFSCRSDNWVSMTCNWTPPNNFVVTDYRVSFGFPILTSRNNVTAVPDNDAMHSKMNFTLREAGTPFYRQAQEIYEFYIEMNNTFGRKEQNFTWNHFENIYLKPPIDLVCISKSPNYISFRWNASTFIPALPRNITYRIVYKCANFCDYWKEILYTPKNGQNQTLIYYNLTGLEYAHVAYDIRVSMKVEGSLDKTYSDYSPLVVITESKIPDNPPPTTQGSFQIVDGEFKQEVYVYFQQIKPQAENGDKFKYVVESDPPLELAEVTSAYAKFVNLTDKTQYTMRIWSENQIGRSINSSLVVIPSLRLKKPSRISKIVHTNVKYELEWAPNDINRTTNYTVFWCEHQNDRPYQCTGFLNWTVIPNNLTKYNITVPPTNKIYQFAVAANGKEGNSGLSWATCTILANRTVLKINELLVKSTGSDFIELNWRQDCPDQGDVTGYVIFYCATNDTHSDNCSTPMRNVTIKDRWTDSASVKYLTPYTTYLLAVSLKTKSGVGARSDWVRNNTIEAAPSTPPINITFSHITNSSVTIHWVRPVQINGLLTNYIIHYNGKKKVIPETFNSYYILTDLESYMEYSISMTACTLDIKCSDPSASQTVYTKMGIPDAPHRPYTDDVNSEPIKKIFWEKPDNPRGEIQYYQLLISHNKNNVTREIINGTNQTFFLFNNCGADSKYSNYDTYIRVRAVNIIDNEHYTGPFSEPLKTSCSHTSWLILYIILGIAGIIMLLFLFRRMYGYYKIMQDVKVKLPAGLAPAVERSEKGLPDIDTYPHDKQFLLKKIEKCPTGDSSGCSSGQESITSSAESTTHLSTDSGTDQPRNVTDDNKENSLRLRNVSNKVTDYVLHDPSPTINRGTKTVPTLGGDYCVLGVDPSNKPVQDTPYVTISDVETSTSPYISNDKPPSVQPPYTDFFKTPNPGYVPFSNPEPASKNTGYVIAGDLSTPAGENTSNYLLSKVPVVGLKPAAVWQPPIEPSLTKPGYVSVGDASPSVNVKETSKGYVPHRQFESKSLKED